MNKVRRRLARLRRSRRDTRHMRLICGGVGFGLYEVKAYNAAGNLEDTRAVQGYTAACKEGLG